MMMENFMNGFPGREHQIRNALRKVIGQEKTEFFFDKFLEYFFMDKDAEFLSSLGFNCVRLSFNYHHFEDDMKPFEIKEEGFKHVDRVVEIASPPTPNADDPVLTVISAQNTTFIQSSICTPALAVKTKTGTATTPPDMLPFGTTSTSKTASSTCGSTSPVDTKETPGSRDTTP